MGDAGDVDVARAADPLTAAATLLRLAGSRSVAVREAAVGNPSTPVAVLAVLAAHNNAADNNRAERFAVAASSRREAREAAVASADVVMS